MIFSRDYYVVLVDRHSLYKTVFERIGRKA